MPPLVSWGDRRKGLRKKTDEAFIDRLPIRGLTYRPYQHKYARTILESLLDHKILLIEAGVGTGKSIGYIVPSGVVYETTSSFNTVLISTSSRALQKQLEEDIKNVSELLELNIKVVISKGMNNYACFSKLVALMKNVEKSSPDFETLSEMRRILAKEESFDIDILSNKLKNPFWREIAVSSVSQCNPNKCAYYQRCKFVEEQAAAHSPGKKIIITNHAKLANLINDETMSQVDAIIIDEAHDLPQQMKLALTKTFSLSRLDDVIYRGLTLAELYILTLEDESAIKNLVSDLIPKYEQFKYKLKNNAYHIFQNNKNISSLQEENIDSRDINPGGEYLNQAIRELFEQLKKLKVKIDVIKKRYRGGSLEIVN